MASDRPAFHKETLEGDNAYEVGPTAFVPHMGQSHTPGMEDHPIFLIPSRELTYPPKNGILKMIFLFPRWDMLVLWRVCGYKDQRRSNLGSSFESMFGEMILHLTCAFVFR